MKSKRDSLLAENHYDGPALLPQLPIELLQLIVGQLLPADIGKVAQTSRLLRSAVGKEQQVFWKRQYFRFFNWTPACSRRRLQAADTVWLEEFKKQYAATRNKLKPEALQLYNAVHTGCVESLQETHPLDFDLLHKAEFTFNINWASVTKNMTWIAAYAGHLRLLNYIYSIVHSEYQKDYAAAMQRSEDRILLHWAVICNQLDEVKRLVACENVNAAPEKYSRNTPLYVAAQRGFLEVTKVLVAANANVNAVQDTNATPFLIAAENGHETVVKYLLENCNIDKNVLDKNRRTALFLAVQNDHVGVVRILLSHQVDVTIALRRAPKFMLDETAHLDATIRDRLTNFFKKHNIDTDDLVRFPITVLEIASIFGNHEIYQMLQNYVKEHHIELRDSLPDEYPNINLVTW